MSIDVQEFEDLEQESPVTVAGRVDPQLEDMYWGHSYVGESYFSAGLDYEDYAPAYCVGYIGYAQYGGDFDDAEKSLCANWLRIKGDSRLTLEQALLAMRAAWDRMAMPRAATIAEPAKASLARRLMRLQRHVPSMRPLSASLAR